MFKIVLINTIDNNRWSPLRGDLQLWCCDQQHEGKLRLAKHLIDEHHMGSAKYVIDQVENAVAEAMIQFAGIIPSRVEYEGKLE